MGLDELLDKLIQIKEIRINDIEKMFSIDAITK